MIAQDGIVSRQAAPGIHEGYRGFLYIERIVSAPLDRHDVLGAEHAPGDEVLQALDGEVDDESHLMDWETE